MARKPVNTWDQYLITGNTGGEGGHDITKKNPNYISGNRAPGSTPSAISKSSWKSYYTNIITTRNKPVRTKRDSKNLSYWERKMGTIQPQWGSKGERKAFFAPLAEMNFDKALKASLKEAPGWEDTSYYKTAFRDAWKKDKRGVRSAYTPDYQRSVTGNTGGEGGHDMWSTSYGAGGLSSDEHLTLALDIASGAQKTMDVDYKTIYKGESERETAADFKARGVRYTGTVADEELEAAYGRSGKTPKTGETTLATSEVGGARRSTYVTGRGLTGKLGAAAVKKRTLLGGE